MAVTRLLLLLFLSGISSTIFAEEEVRVIGLFKNAAMVDYAGKQKLYRVGQKLSPTIQLVEADPHSATFIINGQKQELTLQKVGLFNAHSNLVAPVDSRLNKVAKIIKSNNGMFKTVGLINGVSVQFLVDTGASQVAMNGKVANRIGLPYQSKGKKIAVSTAAGLVGAWAIKLDRVRVGGIQLRNVDAMVIDGAGPDEVLLGMSFLGRVKMVNDGNLLELTKKY